MLTWDRIEEGAEMTKQKLESITSELSEEVRPTIDSIKKTSKEVTKALKEDMKIAFDVNKFKKKGTKEFENTFGFVPFSVVEEKSFDENFLAGGVFLERFRLNLKMIESNYVVIIQRAKNAEMKLSKSIEIANGVHQNCFTFHQEIMTGLPLFFEELSVMQKNVVSLCDKIKTFEEYLNKIETDKNSNHIKNIQDSFNKKIHEYRSFQAKEYEDYERSHEGKKLLEKLKNNEEHKSENDINTEKK